jgi:hypothetical protein
VVMDVTTLRDRPHGPFRVGDGIRCREHQEGA